MRASTSFFTAGTAASPSRRTFAIQRATCAISASFRPRLVAAGVPERDAGNICPWKTAINIRALDNAVMYYTYQHCEELQEKAEEE